MFNSSLHDSQATPVEAISPFRFDFDRYAEYAAEQDRKVSAFIESDSGVLVYRRFRVAEVFSAGCRDREHSLSLQLGALNMSMDYTADMANFLEPWYGFGIGSAAFGSNYIWRPNQSPVIPAQFHSVKEALSCEIKPIHETQIGKEQLAYIEYFMDITDGKLPVSPGDIQSSIDVISELMPISDMFLDMVDDPDSYADLAIRISRLMTDFNRREISLLGDAAAFPGHGFASSRVIKGLGVSADTGIMMNNSMFDESVAPQIANMCLPFGGAYFHSCGNWEI